MIQQSLDETVVWSFGPLLRSDGTKADDLTDADVWTWKVWAGDDQAPVATGSGTLRTVANGDDGDGQFVDVTIGTSAVGSLAPGTYDFRLYKNPGTDDVVAFSDSIRLTFAPGSAAALSVYCTFNDLTTRQSWVESLQDTATTQAGFAEQRHRARQWLDSCIVSRRRRDLDNQGFRRVLWPTVDANAPLSCADAGPSWGPSSIPVARVRDDLTAIQGYLDADKLMTGDGDNDQAADITAWYSLYLIALPQAAGASTDKDWSGWAATCKRNAIRACSAWTARIDTDDDGVADYELEP